MGVDVPRTNNRYAIPFLVALAISLGIRKCASSAARIAQASQANGARFRHSVAYCVAMRQQWRKGANSLRAGSKLGGLLMMAIHHRP